MTYRASPLLQDPRDYFLEREPDGTSRLRVADVVLRAGEDPKDIFARIIRFATNSSWNHSALVFLLSNLKQGYDSTFLIEAITDGVRVADWRKTIVPYKQFSIGVKRVALDWYAETTAEQARHSASDPEDTHGIDYLRAVRGVALDQINGMYDKRVLLELIALYIQRVTRRHLQAFPIVIHIAAAFANFFRAWSLSNSSSGSLQRFICSGLMQYSFFEALRNRILNAREVEEDRSVALHNLNNMHRIIFCEDPDKIIATYVQQVQQGKRDLADPIPESVLDLLKTATPADFNNSPNLKWHYVIYRGTAWQIDEVESEYAPQSEDEARVIALLQPEHRSLSLKTLQK